MSDERKMAFEVKWRIENIESRFETRDDALYSPQFVAETLSDTRWKLSLSTNWLLAEKYASLTLQRDVEDDGPESIALNSELSILSRDSWPLKSKSGMKKFASKTMSHELNVKEIEIFNERKETYLSRNALTVRCTLWETWSKVSKVEYCSIRSVVGTKCLTLYGAIDNYNNLDNELTINFKSPSTEISLISFNILQDAATMNFSRKEVKCKCFSRYSCSLFILDAEGGQHLFYDGINLQKLLDSSNPVSFYSSLYWNPLKMNACLQKGTLKMKFEIAYYPGIESECIEYTNNDYILSAEKYEREFKNFANTEKTEFFNEDEFVETSGRGKFSFTTLKENLTSLYSDRLFCDIKLRNDTETFPAHKCILSARSPVFKKMFTTDMKEAAGGCINVPDISSDTLRRMLQFLYTDCTGELDMQSAMDLYVASDKYDIASLKERCSSFMKNNLCLSNVCEIIVLADLHQDKNLESAANEYIFIYDEEVFSSDEWKIFMQNYTGLAARVMHLKCMKK